MNFFLSHPETFTWNKCCSFFFVIEFKFCLPVHFQLTNAVTSHPPPPVKWTNVHSSVSETFCYMANDRSFLLKMSLFIVVSYWSPAGCHQQWNKLRILESIWIQSKVILGSKKNCYGTRVYLLFVPTIVSNSNPNVSSIWTIASIKLCREHKYAHTHTHTFILSYHYWNKQENLFVRNSHIDWCMIGIRVFIVDNLKQDKMDPN